jgi:hypothetical protein
VAEPHGRRPVRSLIRDAAVDVGSAAAPAIVRIQPGGAILGSGVRSFLRVPDGLVRNDGLMVGPLTVEGDYAMTSSGVLAGAIAAIPPGAASLAARSPAGSLAALGASRRKPALPAPGPIVVTGDAELGGTLLLRFLNGFAPKQGDVFELLRVDGTATGAFEDVAFQGVRGEFELAPQGGVFALTALEDAVALPAVSLKAKASLKEKKEAGDHVQAHGRRLATDRGELHGGRYRDERRRLRGVARDDRDPGRQAFGEARSRPFQGRPPRRRGDHRDRDRPDRRLRAEPHFDRGDQAARRELTR